MQGKGVWLLVLLWVATTCAMAADDITRVFRLGFRSGSDLVTTLKGVYGDKATISAMGDKLVVRASPAIMQEIEGLVGSLDKKPRMLRIAVKGKGMGESQSRAYGVNGSVRFGNGSPTSNNGVITVGGPRPAGGIIVGGPTQNAGVSFNETQNNAQSNVERYVMVEEGQPASIEGLGSSQVVARMQPDGSVSVQVVNSPAATDGTQPRAQSTVMGNSGDWINVGGVNTSAETNSSGILNGQSAKSNGASNLMIKVDPVN